MKTIRCLFVDDNASLLPLYQEYMKAHPQFEAVVVTADATVAIQAIREQPLDLIFTDLDMPSYSGLDILATLEEQGNGSKGFLITGSTLQKEDVDSSVLVDVLIKPVFQRDFDEAIRKFLDSR